MSLIHIKHQLRQLPYSEMMALSRELSTILMEKQGEIEAECMGTSWAGFIPEALAKLAEGGKDTPKLSDLERQERDMLTKIFSRQRSILVSRPGSGAFGASLESLGLGMVYNTDLRAALNQLLDTALVIHTFKG